MKIAVLSDGSAEALALSHLLSRVVIDGVQILRPTYCNMQPKDTADQIARQALTTIRILQARGAERFVIIIDREDRRECPGDWASCLARSIRKLGVGNVAITIKDRKFENWLIADPDGVASLKNVFSVSKTKRSEVEPNKADNVHDAARWLGECSRSGYKKGVDQERLCKAICFRAVAKNSRSFRKFLQVLGHPLLLANSKNVVTIP